MKKEENKYIPLNHYKINIKWILILFIAIFILSVCYINFVEKLIYQNVYNNITELSQQTATQLNLSITDQKSFVQTMVDTINIGDFNTIDQIFDSFSGTLANYHFTRLVILDKEGNGVTSDGHQVRNYANIEEFFNNQDEVYLSENRPSTVSDNQVNIYSKTFTLDGKELVLMATINTQDYKEILLRRLFGKGGTYLINNEGIVLIDSFDLIKQNNVNFYDFMKSRYNITNSETIEKIDFMAANIKKQEIGTFDLKLNKDTYFIHYEKVNINNWYVVTIAAYDTIAKELFTLVVMSFVLCMFITLVIIGIAIYIDISSQKQNIKLYKVAYIDSVTSLGNESYFIENGTKYLNKETKNKYIISLDVDKFKSINDIYGYEFGNSVLKIIGKELSKILPEDSIICRVSNDVFATIFSYNKDIKQLLNKAIANISKIKIDNITVTIKLSIGVYKITEKDTDINKILNKSYMARNKVKGLYNTYFYIFDNILEDKLFEEQQIEASMESALENNEFKVVYQPKFFVNNEKLSGAEALVRWYKDGNIISPNKFIPLFERNKFIIKLDLYIFEQVCKDIVSWKEKYNYIPTVSINVSKEHFVKENFIEDYVKICNKYNIDTSTIDLEITESATVDEDIDILKILNSIKEKGFIISLDDFGTGYSSLSMLQNMPIDIMKIDKIFVDKADLNSNRNIINYIMLIAKQLGVKTIAEGVEIKEQVKFIQNLECDIIQGYYYSKPISKEEFERFFNK